MRREIERVMLKNPGYGSPRVAIALNINEKRAARVMSKYALRPARRAKAPCKPADQGRESLEYPCILSLLSPIAPDVVWASDFTFICYRGAFVYLCTVLDVFTGEVLGFNISRTHDANFVLLAIRRAIERTGTVPLWFHSDQGSEYASGIVRTFLASHGINISMNPSQLLGVTGRRSPFSEDLRLSSESSIASRLTQSFLKSSTSSCTTSPSSALKPSSKCPQQSFARSGLLDSPNYSHIFIVINRL